MPFIATATAFVHQGFRPALTAATAPSCNPARCIFRSDFISPPLLSAHSLHPHHRRHHAQKTRTLPSRRAQTPLATAITNDGAVIQPSAPPSAQLPASVAAATRRQNHVLRFGRLILRQWRPLIPALFCAIVAATCASFEPILFGRILGALANIPNVPIAQSMRKIHSRIATIAFTYVIELCATAVFVSLAARVVDRAMRTLRQQLFHAVLANDVSFFDRTGRAHIERTASLQLRIVRQAIWDNLGEDRGIRAILEAIFGVILCLRLTGVMGIPIFCIFLPTISTIVALLGLRLGRLGAQVEGKEADFLSFISERMRGLRTLKAFGAERKEYGDLSNLLDNARHTTTEYIDARSFTECANRLQIYITTIVFFICGGHMVGSGAMTFETFSSLIGFIWVLNYCMHGILFTVTDASKAAVALRKAYDILDEAHEYREGHDQHFCPPTELPATFQGEIRFENVSFHYPSRPDSLVLKGVSLKMRPGETVALVGESGGGKSTIAALLSRFYSPTSGTITLDGIDIQCLPSDVYSRQLSVVDQEPFLFQGTIRENIAYGLPDEEVPDEDIERAAKEANAHSFISQLSDGYDTAWHPGSNLSGGQRQRVAIARCLLKKPRVCIYDEATSQLDASSERLVQDALERAGKGRTTIVVAHRLSTIKDANVIAVVERGQVVESGTYDALMSRPGGHFRCLIDSAAGVVCDSVEAES